MDIVPHEYETHSLFCHRIVCRHKHRFSISCSQKEHFSAHSARRKTCCNQLHCLHPLVAAYVLFHMLVDYIYEIRTFSYDLFEMTTTSRAHLRHRRFNELQHVFDERMSSLKNQAGTSLCTTQRLITRILRAHGECDSHIHHVYFYCK